MSPLADAPESKTPPESERAADDRTSFSLLILQRVDRVEDEVRDLRQEVHQEIGRVHTEIGQVRTEIGQVRQEVTGLHAEMHGLGQWAVGTVVAIVIGVGGVIVTLLTHHP